MAKHWSALSSSFLPPAGAWLIFVQPGEPQTVMLLFSKWMMTLPFSKLTATCCPSLTVLEDCVQREYFFHPSRQGGHCYCKLSRHLSLISSDWWTYLMAPGVQHYCAIVLLLTGDNSLVFQWQMAQYSSGWLCSELTDWEFPCCQFWRIHF